MSKPGLAAMYRQTIWKEQDTMTTDLAGIPGKWASPDPSTTSTLPKGGANLTYMGHAEVTLALIACDPEWNWEPAAIDPATGGPLIQKQGNRLVMWGWLELGGVRRLCVGTCEERKGDPEKELIGDLLRNGAMRFGIGTKLWSKATDADPFGSGGAGGYDRPSRPQAARSAPARPDVAPDGPKPATEAQLRAIAAMCKGKGMTTDAERYAAVGAVLGREITTTDGLLKSEASAVLDALSAGAA